jgi:hypothetical protein
MRRSYIPAGDIKFLEWVKQMIAYAKLHNAKFQVPMPTGELEDAIGEFEICLRKCASPNKGKVDTHEKNIARKTVEKLCRSYVQGFLAKNPYVSDIDRDNMGLTVYDYVPSAVGMPVGLVTATVSYPNQGALLLSLTHVENTPDDPRANYGVKIAYDVYGAAEPAPVSAEQLRKSVFTRRKKELFTFEQTDTGKIARFCMRYENSKGQAGQWGQIIAAIIP